jgi:hypothetical protein
LGCGEFRVEKLNLFVPFFAHMVGVCIESNDGHQRNIRWQIQPIPSCISLPTPFPPPTGISAGVCDEVLPVLMSSILIIVVPKHEMKGNIEFILWIYLVELCR